LTAGCITISSTSSLEYVGIKYRGIVGNIIWTPYGFGYMIFSLLAFLTKDWKSYILIPLLGGIPLLLMYRYVLMTMKIIMIMIIIDDDDDDNDDEDNEKTSDDVIDNNNQV